MSALIKSGDRAQLLLVQPVEGTRQASMQAVAELAPSPEEMEIRRLEAALLAAQEELLAARQQQAGDVEKVRASALAEGRAAGRRESDELLAALAQSATEVRRHASEALSGSATMALAIARTALARIFGERNQWAAMVADIIAERRARIDEALFLRVRVSAADFPDTKMLNLPARAGQDIETIADPGLASGSCQFELRLGEMEVGPVLQSGKLLSFIDTQLGREGRP